MAFKEIETGGNGMFPSDFVSPEVKASKEYSLKWAEATNNPNQETRIDFERLRAFARGDQPIDFYKPILGEKNKKVSNDPNNQSYRVLDWQILDVATKFVNILIGKITKRDNSVGIKAIDKAALDERRKKKIELQEYVINKPLLDGITASTGISFEGPANEDTMPPPQNLGEVETYQDMFYKEKYCLAVQDMLREINEQDNYTEILMSVARDAVEIGWLTTKTYRVGNKIRRRRCVRERMGMASSTKDNFEDAKWVYEDWDLTIGQLKEIAGDQFTEEVYKKIAETVGDMNFGNVGVREYYEKNMCYPWDHTKITVRDLIWFSPDWETYQVQKNELGNVSVNQKEYDWWEEQRMNKMTEQSYNEANPQSKVIRYSLDNQYQCMWVKGTKYVFNYGKSKDMLKNESNLGRTVSPFTIYKLKKSPIEVVIPIFNNIQINWLQYQHHAAKSKPSGRAINITSLLDVSLEGAGGKRITPKQLLELYYQTGDQLYKETDIQGNRSNRPPVTELLNGMNPAAAQHFQFIVNDINLLRDQIGLNELTDASTPNSEMGKAVATMAAGATEDALRPLYFGFDQVNLLTHEKTVMFISGMAATGLAPHYTEAIGMDQMSTLALLSDLTHHELGCYLERQPTEEMRAKLSALLAQGVAAGSLYEFEAFEVEMEPNIYRAIKLMKMYWGQKQKAAKAQSDAQIQANTQAQIQSNQAASEAKMGEMQQEWGMKSEYEWTKAQAQAWADKQRIANEAFLLSVKAKLDQGLALSDAEQDRMTKLMVVERTGQYQLQIAKSRPKPSTTKK